MIFLITPQTVTYEVTTAAQHAIARSLDIPVEWVAITWEKGERGYVPTVDLQMPAPLLDSRIEIPNALVTAALHAKNPDLVDDPGLPGIREFLSAKGHPSPDGILSFHVARMVSELRERLAGLGGSDG